MEETSQTYGYQVLGCPQGPVDILRLKRWKPQKGILLQMQEARELCKKLLKVASRTLLELLW
jgi:hypothetical protein